MTRSATASTENTLTPMRAGSADSLAPALRTTLVRLGIMQGFDEKQVRAAVKAKTGRDLDEVTICGTHAPN